MVLYNIYCALLYWNLYVDWENICFNVLLYMYVFAIEHVSKNKHIFIEHI